MKTTIIIVVLIVLAILLKPVLFKKQAIINNVDTVNNDVLSGTSTNNSNVLSSTTIKATTTKSNTITNNQNFYKLTEIAKHNNSNDCWMAISGGVYDVTRFADSHPGGDAIYRGCGIDATSMYNSVSGHQRPSAPDNLKKLLIGMLQN